METMPPFQRVRGQQRTDNKGEAQYGEYAPLQYALLSRLDRQGDNAHHALIRRCRSIM
jgi:hypothetical protein